MNAAASFENILNLDTVTAGLLLLVWAVAGCNASRTAGRPTRRAVRAGARRGLGYLALGLLLVLVKLALIAALTARGWAFGGDRVLVVAPVLLVPAVAVVVWTLPRMLRLARLPDPTRDAPSWALQGDLAAPALVLPVHATALGALFGLHLGFLAPITPPLLGPAVLALCTWLVLVALLRARLVRRARGLGSAGPPAQWPRRLARRAAVTVAVVVLLTGGVAWAAASSRLPDRIAMHGDAGPSHSGLSHSGAAHPPPGAGGVDEHSPVSVADLVERDAGEPDRRITLVARDARIRLASGRVVEGHTFNDRAPGPEIRVRQGELLEVELVNEMTTTAVTVHWHGLNVPNAADGVPGVTQDAVAPGGRFRYLFRADEIGTHWYHTHQDSAAGVAAGLFGALIVESAGGPPPAEEIVVPMHAWPSNGGPVQAFGTSDVLDRRAVPPGTNMRLRIVDTDVMPRRFVLEGTPFRVTALDGQPVVAPTEISEQLMTLGSGGRMDLEFTMPDGPVRLAHLFDPDGGLLLSPDGTGDLVPRFDRPDFDVTRYGTPAPTPFGPASRFDAEHLHVFDSVPGFYDGSPTFLWTTNGLVFPDLPSIVVREGDLVKVRFVNRSRFDHPMHLHGHRMLVLSRNGRPVTGSPVWLDTLDVDVGEEWEIAFHADNPGVWMDHCHNFLHAAVGMMMHVSYEGVGSPYLVGRTTGNNPA